jgi:uncharacterized protein with PIN domain
MQFVADAMLGKLARWLRIMGYDTLCAADMPVDDDDLINIALDEKRILLTRDKDLYHRAIDAGVRAIYVASTDIVSQLVQLVKLADLELRDEPAKTICPSCNGSLMPVSKFEVRGMVPATVLDTHDKFWIIRHFIS